ncbi:MAG: CBS domain-containing protein [Thermaerobacter sp.]|jgi:CBS domain-containing protein/sporulation protein YlmC with PRC-barrel domain|nr:CBS domain-containing protein [Thermaerobacter sp.]
MFFLSQVLGRRVRDRGGRPSGRVADLVVPGHREFPLVRAVALRRGREEVLVPWRLLDGLEGQITLKVPWEQVIPYRVRAGDLRVAHDLLDRQIVDVEGRKVVRVNDLHLARTNGHYRLLGVDISTAALLRRLGLGAVVDVLPFRERVISWEDVDPIHSEADRLQLKVAHRNLSRMHPADIAEVVDRLSLREGLALLESLEAPLAADALEEVSPERQADLLEGMDSERAADLLEEMDPDDAADVLQDLPHEKAAELLGKMEREDSAEVRGLLDYPEDSAGGVMSVDFLAMRPDLLVPEAMEELRRVAPEVEMIYYLYLTDAQGRLVGVLSLRELLTADPSRRLEQLARKDVVRVGVRDDERTVAKVVAKYNLLAVPVVDDENRLRGIITVDDAMDILLPVAWRKRLPKLFV